MTMGQMYQFAMDLWDKSGSPYMPQIQFDTFSNLKYNAWLDLEGKMVEKTEGYMADLIYLFTAISKPNSTFIDQTIDTPNFRRRIRFNSTYKNCNGVVKQPNIRILSNANVDIAQNDPLIKGIDSDPACVATPVPSGNPGWQVFSDTTPLSLNMTYLRNPQIINSNSAPNTNFEGPDYIAWILIALVVYRMDVTIENLARAKADISDLAPQLAER